MLRFFYDSNSESMKEVATIIASVGYEVTGKAITAQQALWFPGTSDEQDVAIFLPEAPLKNEQWTGRHVMTSTKKITPKHMPKWAADFPNHLVIRRVGLDGFEYAILEAILRLHRTTNTEPTEELNRRVASLRARPLPQSQPYS